MARKITIGEMQEAAMLGHLPEDARKRIRVARV